ncbi:MAG: AzlD domain-containing protein [Hyphomicrobiaceae bacterium]|nr:AzlD domain-containing protein [Hyphomicrobiaceae bacterium]
MTSVLSTFEGTLIILAVALFMHEPFRWLGLYLGRNLSADSAIFTWVKAVSNAIVAALVMRLLLFPAGELAAVPLALRLVAFASGIGLYYASGRQMSVGVVGGAAVLVAGALLGK